MIRALERILKSENLLAEDDRLVVGVSGGADSVALLHLLLELNQQCGWRLHLHVAHLNHQLRGKEADEDEAFVRALAVRLSLSCTTERRDVKAIALERSQTVEESGRRERYEFFERVCLQTNSEAVVVAHHADDQAETVLHRILRGTGLRGLAGIPRDRTLQPRSLIRLKRPLLHVPRRELIEYLRQRNIVHRHDHSNESTEPTRNWIRIHLLPLVRAELNSKADDALLRLAEQAALLRTSTDDLVARTLESIVIEQNETRFSLNAESLSHKSRYLQTAVIAHVCRAMGVREKKLSSAHMAEVVSLISEPDVARPAMLPGGWRFMRSRHELILEKPTVEFLVPPYHAPIPLQIPSTTESASLGLTVTAELIERSADSFLPEDCGVDRLVQYVDWDAVKQPLVVRTRLKGDRFHPLGAVSAKSLAHFFIDQKIDRGVRNRIPIICDQLGPIWIVGHRIDDRVKLTSTTNRMLRLKVQIEE